MGFGKGYKYRNEDIIYISFKKHSCPKCNTVLKTTKVKKKVSRNSPEGENFNWNFGSPGHNIYIDEAVFVWKEFVCPNCNTHFTVEEIQKHEGVYTEETPENIEKDKKAKVRDKIIFFAIGLALGLLFILLKYRDYVV